MLDFSQVLKAREAFMAYPEASLAILVFGSTLGFTFAVLLGRRELRVNRAIVEAVKDANLSQESKDKILQHSIPKSWRWVDYLSIGASVLALVIAVAVLFLTARPELGPVRHQRL